MKLFSVTLIVIGAVLVPVGIALEAKWNALPLDGLGYHMVLMGVFLTCGGIVLRIRRDPILFGGSRLLNRVLSLVFGILAIPTSLVPLWVAIVNPDARFMGIAWFAGLLTIGIVLLMARRVRDV